MKSGHNIILILIIIIGCAKNNSNNDIAQTTDSTKFITALGDEEQAMWEYFESVERDLGNDPKIKKEKISELIQSLIDNGDLQQPIIFLDGEKGTEPKTVDYLTYKEFRRNNPIDPRRPYVVSLQMTDNSVLDSIRMDSIGMDLLKQLSRDSI
jgi:hypothetical protein